jgi:hypothetical protein
MLEKRCSQGKLTRKLTSIEQGLMAGPNCQLAREKMAQPRAWESSGFYRRGRVRKLVQVL